MYVLFKIQKTRNENTVGSHLSDMPDSDASIIDTVKRAIDDDDDQQLETLLEQLIKRPGRMDLVIDKLYEGFHGRSCLHRLYTSTMIP